MITNQLIKQQTQQQQPTKIYKLQLSNRLLHEISGLRNLHKLRYLDLNFNMIRVIGNLGALTDLRELHVAHNQIEEIGGLESNRVLNVLDLSNNRIRRIQNIGHLQKLETLLLADNQIQKINGLQTLKDLKKLSINSNNLSSIDSLTVFSKLETLHAQHNQITQLSPKIFQKSTKLTHLNLSYNCLKEIGFLGCLPALEYLDVSHNCLRGLVVGGTLRYLEYLDIGYNQFQGLMRVAEVFPELTTFLFNNNMIASQYQIISNLAGSQFLIQINFLNNPMYTPQFEQTMFQVYHFDRINGKDFSKKPGTKYTEISKTISKNLNNYHDIEDDEEDRKIKMSGFYDEELEVQMTGVRGNRPVSPARKSKAVMSLNYEEFEKAYQNIKSNDQRIEMLRNTCKLIFQKNGINTPSCPILQTPQELHQNSQNCQQNYQQHSQAQQPSTSMVTELKTDSIMDKKALQMKKINEEQANKWKQLKNKQKNFNIRGVRRGVSGSQRKSGLLDGSASRITSQEISRDNLMRTQLNPPRWNNDPALMKTTIGYRPLSAKKKI